MRSRRRSLFDDPDDLQRDDDALLDEGLGDDDAADDAPAREPYDDEALADALSPEDGAALDDDFPLGDGVADTEGEVQCPYCGEPNDVALDPGGGPVQEYVEDCHVCCRPWRLIVTYHEDGTADVWADPADGS